MIAGSVREVKDQEYRVGLTPEAVSNLTRLGHRVLIETSAGAGSGFEDAAYAAAGADIVATAAEVWGAADLVVKVKEPQPQEFGRLRRDLTLFTYLHLAALPEVARALMDAGTTSIAYETVELPDGSLPLLVPMSQIAGRMAPQVGARWLMKPGPGRGRLLSSLPGSPAARVVIFGAGTVSRNACEVAVNLGARVRLLSRGLESLRRIEERWPGVVETAPSTPAAIEAALEGADLVISGVNVRGGRVAPKLVSRRALAAIGPGGVIVDVAIDQGGVFETSRPTTHSDPVFVEEGVVHYCVANMPGAVPRTSTAALSAATTPYVLALAEQGAEAALAADPSLAKGLMTRGGELVAEGVARSLNL